MKLRALAAIFSIAVGISLAALSTTSVLAGCGTCGSGGSNNNGQLSVVQDYSLSYDATTIQAMPAPAPSGVTNALPLQCTGTQDNYYALTISNISTIYLNGVNSVGGSVVGLSGGSPNGNVQYNTQTDLGALDSPPINDQLTPDVGYYATWQGSWYVTSWGTSTTNQYGWVKSNPAVTTTQNPLPKLPSGEKWVQTGWVRVGYSTVPIYTQYDYVVIGTTTTTYPTACGLHNWKFQGFGTTPYCTISVSGSQASGISATACNTTTTVPTSQSTIRTLLNELEANWSGGSVTSSPPPGSITVWVPTTFSLANSNLPPPTGYPNPPTATVTASLPYDRSLTLTLTAQAYLQPVDWTYTASGGQSGTPGFTCTVQTTGSQLIGGTQTPSNCSSPNAGYSSSQGYVFTHDAQRLTVNVHVSILITVTATWQLNGDSFSAPVSLSGGNTATLLVRGLTSTINQVEGVTQPAG